MKNGYRNLPHLEMTPSALHLPSPKPPFTAPRSAPEGPALPLSRIAEPQPVALKTFEQEETKPRRAKTPSAKRPTSTDLAKTPTPSAKKNRAAKGPKVTTLAEKPLGRTIAESAIVEPLPRNRALIVTQPGAIARFGKWLRSLIMVKRPAARVGRRPAVSQIKALRRDVLMLQKTLDQMLENSRA